MPDLKLPPRYTDASRPPLFRPGLLGVLVIAAFIGAFIAWSAVAPLHSAAVAPGSVSLDTNRKTIQHLEGGIVRSIKVREGDKVTKGQVLVSLDTTKAKAQVALLRAQINAEVAQLRLLREEIRDVGKLLAKGLAHKPRYLSLLRRQAELEGARVKHEAELGAARDIIRRSEIRAPLDGTIVGLTVHTSGGVIKAGDSLMSIVARDERLVIEARVDPNDIDVVRAGLKAQVRLSPYSARNTPPLEGAVRWISADRMTDKATGAPYYLARIALTRPAALREQGVRLYPGMPAEVMIVTGQRTMLAYLAAPLLRSFRRAFRED